ncbi:programmed cell death protein 2 [Glomus cerebriforme]|uniref:Programmed cell death protein 2 n=1 Tax=Glomus cerebriforme TaxID=658196 RepID=A0A397STH1_9GLOM|nr:programmed cell death protein 2 [Glomus cerebriforme]
MAASPTTVVELGFAEPPESPLIAENFPSKVGGRPAWLNPEHILFAEQVRCGVCCKPMILLVQLYTPEDHPPEAFHRTIYVFCCKNGSCHKIAWQQSFKVFRSQLPKNNPYWSENESNPDSSTTKNSPAKQCIICGLLGSKMCGKCNQVNYCSKEHQIEHWTSGQHKIHCNIISTSSSIIEEHNNRCRKLVLFPEFEIVTEQEGENRNEERDGDNNSLNEASSKALVPVGDEIYENTDVDVDKAFLKFQKRIEPYPEQILRYNRLEYESEKNPKPLWVSDIDKPTAQDINPCPYCGQERTFEFQILSTLLNYLEVDHLQQGSLDWGTLLVYSCKYNCHVENIYYISEILWRQNFSDDGLNWKKDLK